MVLSVSPPLLPNLLRSAVCIWGWLGTVAEIDFKASRTKGVTVFLRAGTLENRREP